MAAREAACGARFRSHERVRGFEIDLRGGEGEGQRGVIASRRHAARPIQEFGEAHLLRTFGGERRNHASEIPAAVKVRVRVEDAMGKK